jgi:hypothetical protein
MHNKSRFPWTACRSSWAGDHEMAKIAWVSLACLALGGCATPVQTVGTMGGVGGSGRRRRGGGRGHIALESARPSGLSLPLSGPLRPPALPLVSYVERGATGRRLRTAAVSDAPDRAPSSPILARRIPQWTRLCSCCVGIPCARRLRHADQRPCPDPEPALFTGAAGAGSPRLTSPLGSRSPRN